MTGTEAISNGVSAFEKPREADNAGKTLIAMAVLLGTHVSRYHLSRPHRASDADGA